MNPDNRWVRMAEIVPWDEFEMKYAELFPSNVRNVVKPVQMLGALIIQTKFQFSDRELVDQITENLCLQFFIGLPGYQEEKSFDVYNESACLQEAAERYKERTGHYPERILADKIYRTQKNKKYCKKNGIRLSGPRLGRPCENERMGQKEKRIEYQGNTDRIEVERSFITIQ